VSDLEAAAAWDHDGIDHWKIDPYNEEDAGDNTLVEETSFVTLFPKYREQYLREWWPHVTRELKKFVRQAVLPTRGAVDLVGFDST